MKWIAFLGLIIFIFIFMLVSYLAITSLTNKLSNMITSISNAQIVRQSVNFFKDLMNKLIVMLFIALVASALGLAIEELISEH